jgi:AN1-type zinc finger protein 5/6
MEHNKDKCIVCNKKVGLLPYICKCGNTTCAFHRWPNHECCFDYRQAHKDLLQQQNPKIAPSKINVI